MYMGTPAGGAGIHGVLEMGCSVIALCFDEHHKRCLRDHLVQRAVEAMLSCTTNVFTNECLVARAKEMHITQDIEKPPKKRRT